MRDQRLRVREMARRRVKLASGAFGAPAVVALMFEVLLKAISMFNCSNVRLSRQVDRVLRRIAVMPGMQRVHPSAVPRETRSNFGSNLPSWWDGLFGPGRAQPAAGHEGMATGPEQVRDPGERRLDRMLLQPFYDDCSCPLDRRETAEFC